MFLQASHLVLDSHKHPKSSKRYVSQYSQIWMDINEKDLTSFSLPSLRLNLHGLSSTNMKLNTLAIAISLSMATLCHGVAAVMECSDGISVETCEDHCECYCDPQYPGDVDCRYNGITCTSGMAQECTFYCSCK